MVILAVSPFYWRPTLTLSGPYEADTILFYQESDNFKYDKDHGNWKHGAGTVVES